MNRVMERVIQPTIAAKAIAECKSNLFSTRRKGLLLCFALNVMYLSAAQRYQAGRPSHSQRCFSSKCRSPEK